MKPFSFAIDLPVLNQWQNVDLLRTSVQNCFITVFSNIERCNAIAMVTGELVENAVKYGDWEGDQRSFRLLIHGESNRVVIQVDNPVVLGTEQIGELAKILAWIDTQPSPEDAFQAKLIEIAANPRGEGGASGLGLVRCVYEASAKLRHQVLDDGRTLRVLAELLV